MPLSRRPAPLSHTQTRRSDPTNDPWDTFGCPTRTKPQVRRGVPLSPLTGEPRMGQGPPHVGAKRQNQHASQHTNGAHR